MGCLELIVVSLLAAMCTSVRVQNRLPGKIRFPEQMAHALLNSGPVYNVVRTIARNAMVARGDQINVSWKDNVAHYRSHISTLQRNYECLVDTSVVYPDYYVKPFHAYEDGNLSWQAAMEVESAALTVHASCRDIYLQSKMLVPRVIVDIGCSTGLSTTELQARYPQSEVFGLDLSPYMLAVAEYNLKTAGEHGTKQINYLHRAAEKTQMKAKSVDLMSLCLVTHELPQSATRDVLVEAHRILRNGGAVSIMDMDPGSDVFRKLAENPFAFAGLKSTEPWLEEYMSLDVVGLLEEIGFTGTAVMQNSPRHRTIVAFK